MKRWLSLILVLLLLTIPVSAEESLEAIMADYMEQNGLGEHNYSVSYYNTVTGESYVYNDKKFMVAASTFKLPLNMYYYEMERDGEIASDAMIPEAGVTLDVAHRESLVNSNNEYSIGMLYHLGTFPTYKTCMKKYFTMDESEIQDIYYADNYYCTNMMMDALKYLYATSEDFTEMLGYMKQAQPGQYFKAGVKDYEVAHKYGWYNGAVNDVGIIYTDEPFLLAVYTQDAGDWVVADTAELVTAYNVRHAAQPEPEEPAEPETPPQTTEGITLEVEMVPRPSEQPPEPPEEAEDPEPEQTPPDEPSAVPVTEPEEPREIQWLPAVLLLGIVLLSGAALLWLQSKRPKRRR